MEEFEESSRLRIGNGGSSSIVRSLESEMKVSSLLADA